MPSRGTYVLATDRASQEEEFSPDGEATQAL